MTADWIERNGTILHTTDGKVWTVTLVITLTSADVLDPQLTPKLIALATQKMAGSTHAR